VKLNLDKEEDKCIKSGEFLEAVQKAERNIKRRLPIGSKKNVSKLIQEMSRRQLYRKCCE